ncbi:hypothetical protein N658DRAFT_501980 [Parathielavia hyrcaniae]|uniref:Uncharacterized protein n=1 Tax=Parathielavia hyrcaniae TaxID=113614 RepID=A0AAN6PS96_9PEZI|nr:hypothetical protein N658DRAFT_501980 [Parathielavia hyrcaniae]
MDIAARIRAGAIVLPASADVQIAALERFANAGMAASMRGIDRAALASAALGIDAEGVAAAASKLAAGAAVGAVKMAEGAGESATQFASDHPYLTAAMIAGAVVAVAPQVVTVPALHMAGFGAEGVVANSVAAGIHSTIGNVVTGSAFATLQSAGAGGAGAAVVNGVVAGAGAGVAGVAAGRKYLWPKMSKL